MRDGSHKQKIDFRKFEVKRFNPFLYVNVYQSSGCGACAISMLTGINPFKIKYRKDWDAKYIVNFLRKHKFSVQEITKYGVVGDRVEYPINRRHIILLSCMVIKREASWMILYNRNLYHNFEVTELSDYEFLNHPLTAVFLITHDNYK